MAGVRHWQALTVPQVTAANAIGTACAAARVAAGQDPADPVAFLFDCQRRARATGAALAWLGGQPAGILWHREGRDAGMLIMGQLAIAIAVSASHGQPLAWPRDTIADAWVYMLVCDADSPNFALWGWCKGADLADAGGTLARDARAMRDPRDLRQLGTRSIGSLRDAGKLG